MPEAGAGVLPVGLITTLVLGLEEPPPLRPLD